MKVTENELLCYFDVDETLVHWKNSRELFSIKADYYGTTVYLDKNYEHIKFLKAMKARGGHIIVHSGNGWKWAKTVVELLELQDFVDEVKTKPAKVIDDSDYENWMPQRIYIK
jgi:hydroxymethylpyrimidine pyrophosphatase-like HAD family hydrolase